MNLEIGQDVYIEINDSTKDSKGNCVRIREKPDRCKGKFQGYSKSGDKMIIRIKDSDEEDLDVYVDPENVRTK